MNYIGKCPKCLSKMLQTDDVIRRLSVVCNAAESAKLLEDGKCHCDEPFTLRTQAEHERFMNALSTVDTDFDQRDGEESHSLPKEPSGSDNIRRPLLFP